MKDREILLVEHNADDAELSLRALRNIASESRIAHAWDGASALDLVFGPDGYAARGPAGVCNLILLEIELPIINGLEVLRRLKEDVRSRTIPVVMLTASGEASDLRDSFALGANSYIRKPVSLSAYVNRVTEAALYWVLHNHSHPCHCHDGGTVR